MAEHKKFTESILNLTNRQKLSLSGVEKVVVVSNFKIELIASGSNLKITGENLEVEKLDIENGVLRVNGIVNEIKYNETKTPLLKRLFK
ncbi:MAG: YabP/YqfC family sporulation protein [Christensenellales bacterium]|jgi:sporulation protein YabP